MYPVCSFCGERPVVAWFEGPHFRSAVDSADKVRAEEDWVTCAVCLALVQGDDREGLVGRSLERLRRKDRQRGRERSLGEEDIVRRILRDHLEQRFWTPRQG